MAESSFCPWNHHYDVLLALSSCARCVMSDSGVFQRDITRMLSVTKIADDNRAADVARLFEYCAMNTDMMIRCALIAHTVLLDACGVTLAAHLCFS